MSREDRFKVTLTKLFLFKSELSEQWLMWGGEIAVDRSAHSGQPLSARSCIHTHKAWLGSKIIINKQRSQLWPPHSSKSVWEEVLTKEWSSSTVSRKNEEVWLQKTQETVRSLVDEITFYMGLMNEFLDWWDHSMVVRYDRL